MNKYDLPLLIIHGFDFPQEYTREQRREAVRSKLCDVALRGFGGFVSNYGNRDYLRGEVGWDTVRIVAEEAKALGLRMWLYDEAGYPSGGAGGLTLENNPDYECRGAVMIHEFISPNESFTFDFPRGHEYSLALYTYKYFGDADKIDASAPYRSYNVYGKADNVTVTNDTDDELLAVYFVKKHLYEGTHAEHNVYESRRYIDVTNPAAVTRFIDITHEQYRREVGEYFAEAANGVGHIEAIFTDEPSFMGAYINAGLYPPSVRDKFDDTIPLYPVVNWGCDIERKFREEHGYDLLGYMLYLFAGSCEKAREVRGDFYSTMSRLYEEAYFKNIAARCEEMGLPFSGHILLEDDIRLHPIFEGDYFALLRHMCYPGIDMLQSIPETVYSFAFTPKLISSVAHGYGRKHIMSEVSAHAQGGAVTPEQMICSVLLQYAFGVDIFTSYYGMNFAPADKYCEYNRAIGRVSSAMEGERVCRTALYYPIETVQMNTVPSSPLYMVEAQRAVDECADSLNGCMFSLISSQIEFDFVSFGLLVECEAENGVFRTPGGGEFDALVLPACEVTPSLKMQLSRLADAGVRVLYHTPELINRLRERDSSPVILTPDSTPCAALCKSENGYNKILLVNSRPISQNYRADVRGVREDFTVYNPIADSIIPCEKEKTDNGYTVFVQIPPYGAVIIG